MQSNTIGALAAALSKAQAEIRSARKDAENPFFKSRYADLASVWDACRGPLTANQLAVVQTPEPTDGNTVSITTTLIHSSGEWIAGTLTAKPVKNDPQSLGSCITYLRRYALSALVGVAASDGTDDDGNQASQAPHYEPEHVPPTKTSHQRLNELVPSVAEQHELRDYLRNVPGKSGQFGLQPDQELFSVSPELANYMVQNWDKVRKAVFEWSNQVPGAEMPAESAPEEPVQSSWRNAVIAFAPPKHPELKGRTIGQAMDDPVTKNWAFGMLMNYTAKPYQGKISPEDIALQEAGLNWRRENGKLKEGEV